MTIEHREHGQAQSLPGRQMRQAGLVTGSEPGSGRPYSQMRCQAARATRPGGAASQMAAAGGASLPGHGKTARRGAGMSPAPLRRAMLETCGWPGRGVPSR